MKRYFTRWLGLAMAAMVFFTACGGPAVEQQNQSVSQSSPGESAPPALESESSGMSEALEETPSTPASGGDEEPEESSSASEPEASGESEAPEETPGVEEDGWYHTKDEVGLYIHLYNRLPGNYVTKKEAQAQGWPGGNVERYTGEGTAIGGDRFGNREGLLPKAKGRSYTECDIDTVGKDSRGAKRIVFSNDGLVYYTGDHYNTFELLYGEP